MRLSLRELLLLVSCVSLVVVSLKYASPEWQACVTAIAMLAFFAAVIVSVVDRGPRQAFAIGFALVLLSYAAIITSSRVADSSPGKSHNPELDFWEGRLPTTLSLRFVHRAISRSTWIDTKTGKEVPGYDPSKQPVAGTVQGNSFVPNISYDERPPREVFMPIGHTWWGLLLAYSGGLFAVFLYSRRIREKRGV